MIAGILTALGAWSAIGLVDTSGDVQAVNTVMNFAALIFLEWQRRRIEDTKSKAATAKDVADANGEALERILKELQSNPVREN